MPKQREAIRACGVAICVVLLSITTGWGQTLCLHLDSSYDAGQRPQSLAAADFDRDGNVDIATTNWNADRIVIFRGLGNGRFMPGTPISVAHSPNSIVAADFNGDGLQDIAVAHDAGSTVSVLINAGDGTFQPPATYAVSNSFWVCAGDLDGDGDNDLAVANWESPGRVTILRNDGHGTFTIDGSFPSGGANPSSIVAAKLDCDEDLDLAVTNSVSSNVTVLFNNGSADFSTMVTYTAGNGAYSVCAADLNRDGEMDLVTANPLEDSISVLMNSGCGVLSAGRKSSVCGVHPHSVNAADLDCDGDIDVFTADWTSGTLSVLTNDGTGILSCADSLHSGINPAYAGAADFDNDGDADVIVANEYSYDLSAFKNCCTSVPRCDTLRIKPVKLYYGPDGCWAPVNLTNCTPLKGATIPLKYDPLPPSWHFDSVSFAGARMSDWAMKVTSHNPTDRTVLVNALVKTGGAGKTEEPAGTGPLFYLWFSGPTSNYTCSELVDTVCIDTTTIPGSPSPKKLTLVDNGNPAQGFVPIFERGCLYLHHFQIFDFNCDWVLDVIDLVNMIDYVFSGGICPSVCQSADGNCDGVADVFDIVDAIDCIFSGGLCPVCFEAAPAPALAKRAPAEAVADIQTASVNGTDWTATLSVQSPAPWRAAQLEWTFDGPVDQLSVSIDEGAAGLKTYWHLDGQQLKVGLIDIRGEALIAAGSRPILRLSASGDFPGVRLTDCVLVDQNNQGISVSPAAAGAISGVPSSFSLGANYPNPFNAGTVIHYTLGRDGQATVAVFDILGRHVATVADGFQSAGPHEVAWNGTDAHGQAAASGMYFYRLTASGFADSKKMVLLK